MCFLSGEMNCRERGLASFRVRGWREVSLCGLSETCFGPCSLMPGQSKVKFRSFICGVGTLSCSNNYCPALAAPKIHKLLSICLF